MLILARHVDERIIIGDDIEISVVDIRGDQVRLGIVAPKSIAVYRHEVYEHIQRENRAALLSSRRELPTLPFSNASADTTDDPTQSK